MKFKIIKVPLTEEEKRARVEEFNMYEGTNLDVEEFVSQDIYEEFIEFKCLDCGTEVTLEAEIVFELFDPDLDEFPALICNDCSNGTIVPKDLYEEILKKYKKKHR